MDTTTSKRTQITIETNRVLIIRRLRSSRIWCRECDREVDVVVLEEASVLTRMTPLELRVCVETGKWHLSNSPEGELLICLDSLMKSIQIGNQQRMSKGE